jgi:rhodanese-related sulfurtransferase
MVMSAVVGVKGRIATITAGELVELAGRGRAIDLIDVRTQPEYRELHAEPARLVPLDSLDPAAVFAARGAGASEPLYVICRSGSRGRKACEMFLAAGFPNVVNVEGGTLAWESAGLAVVRGKRAISLDRQVRIAAGSLVFLGTALGAFLNPYFLILPAFIGAGLVFAGLTDTCGMGMLLARMPWNRGRASGDAGNVCQGEK